MIRASVGARIAAPAGPRRLAAVQAQTARAQAMPAEAQMSTAKLDEAIVSAATGTRATVGLTSICPYGLGACWGGAYEALQKLDGVQSVRPIANSEDSTADVYLHGDTLPDVDRWIKCVERRLRLFEGRACRTLRRASRRLARA